jgi:hypothetical protein
MSPNRYATAVMAASLLLVVLGEGNCGEREEAHRPALIVCLAENGVLLPEVEGMGDRVGASVEVRALTEGGRPLSGMPVRLACITSSRELTVLEDMRLGFTGLDGIFGATVSASKERALAGGIRLVAAAAIGRAVIHADVAGSAGQIAFLPCGQGLTSDQLLDGMTLQLAGGQRLELDSLGGLTGPWRSRGHLLGELNRYTANRYTMSRAEVRLLTRRVLRYGDTRWRGVRPELVEALIEVESRRNPLAIGGNGELGLGQLNEDAIAACGEDAGETVSVSELVDALFVGDITVTDFFAQLVTDPRADPYENVAGTVSYLASLNEIFEGDELKSVAAYNCGLGRVSEAMGQNGALHARRLPPSTRLRYIPRLLEAGAFTTVAD